MKKLQHKQKNIMKETNGLAPSLLLKTLQKRLFFPFFLTLGKLQVKDNMSQTTFPFFFALFAHQMPLRKLPSPLNFAQLFALLSIDPPFELSPSFLFLVAFYSQVEEPLVMSGAWSSKG